MYVSHVQHCYLSQKRFVSVFDFYSNSMPFHLASYASDAFVRSLVCRRNIGTYLTTYDIRIKRTHTVVILLDDSCIKYKIYHIYFLMPILIILYVYPCLVCQDVDFIWFTSVYPHFSSKQ